MAEENKGLTTRISRLNVFRKVGYTIYLSCLIGMVGWYVNGIREFRNYNRMNPCMNPPAIVQSINSSKNKISQLEAQLTPSNETFLAGLPQEYSEANSRILEEMTNQVAILKNYVSENETDAEYLDFQRRKEDFERGQNRIFFKQLKGVGVIGAIGALLGLPLWIYGRKKK